MAVRKGRKSTKEKLTPVTVDVSRAVIPYRNLLEKEMKEKMATENEKKLKHHAILSTSIGSKENITYSITELLERHRYANIR